MVTRSTRSNDEIRSLILEYLYRRNANATSVRGKKGSAVKIMEMRRDLKSQHALKVNQVMSNLTYLISQGWVEEQLHSRVVPTTGGKQIPSETKYYAITATGIDKIEGPSEFTPRDRFAGIVNNITATDQSTVTLGDGNQVSVQYQAEGETLASLAQAIKDCDELGANDKMDAIADIDTIQAQLARSEPNRTVIKSTWSSIESLTRMATLANLILAVREKLEHFLS